MSYFLGEIAVCVLVIPVYGDIVDFAEATASLWNLGRRNASLQITKQVVEKLQRPFVSTMRNSVKPTIKQFHY
jgi:hypothetical protein